MIFFFTQHSYMFNSLDTKIKLISSKNEFNLMAAASTVGYRSSITFATLLVRKVKLNPAISLTHEKALLQSNVKYPLKQVSLKNFSVPKGMLSYSQDNLFLSQTSTLVVIGLVDAPASTGRIKPLLLTFKHLD